MQPAANLPHLISEKRRKLGLTQKELARNCGLSTTRLSRFENGRRTPNEAEFARICQRLNLCPTLLQPCGLPADHRFVRIARKFPEPTQVSPTRSEPSLTHYRRLRERLPKLTYELDLKLQERSDVNRIRVFLRDAVYESEIQYLASLQLLAAGAVAGRLCPQKIGLTHLPVVDPTTGTVTGHQSYPALGLNQSVFIPQVSLLTTEGIKTLDLVWAERMCGRTFFRDLEITDEPMPSGREETVGMPVLTYRAADVSTGRFLSPPWAA